MEAWHDLFIAVTGAGSSDLLNSLRLFTVVAILVSAFGLAGFLLFHVAGKMLEISVRKVLGAGFIDLVFSLIRELFAFVLVSLAIGIPLSLYIITQWMQSYEFKDPINPRTALYGACIVIFTVIVIAIFLVIKVVNSNPSKYLRKE